MKTALALTGADKPAAFAEIPVQHVSPAEEADSGFRADAVIKTGRITIALSNTA